MFRQSGFFWSALLFMAGTLVYSTQGIAETANHRDFERVYRVTITNLTRGQVFSPPLLATHTSSVALFELGESAIGELATLAEEGNGEPLATLLDDLPQVYEARATSDMILPGASMTFEIRSKYYFRQFSTAGMLVDTNDAFFAIDGQPLPWRKGQRTSWEAEAYDAGSEANNEHCDFVPGPACGGSSRDTGGAEGYVHVHAGVHGIADLMSSQSDWRNPVAQVTVVRVR